MGVSINCGAPEVGLFHGKSHLKMDDLGVPLFQATIGWLMKIEGFQTIPKEQEVNGDRY